MIYEYIGTGKTREAAAKAAVDGLMAKLATAGVKRPNTAELHEEVIALPKKKFFGLLGSTDAEVRVSYDDGKKEKKPAPKKQAQKPQQRAERAPQRKEEAKAAKPQRKAPADERPQREDEVVLTEKDIDMNAAISYLKAMIDGLKVENAQVTGEVKDGVLELTVNCNDYGIIIGRRGETLDSLQYLTGLAVKKACGKYIRVAINVGDYREKRNETLKNIARKHADYVLRTGRRYTFEPMNPYERRIIHTTVQEIEGVESMSVGMGQDRKVVLQPEGGVKYRQGGSAGRRGYSSGRPAAKKSAPIPKDFTKFGKIEVEKDSE